MEDLLCARLCEEKRLYPPGCNRFSIVAKYQSRTPGAYQRGELGGTKEKRAQARFLVYLSRQSSPKTRSIT